MLLHSNTARAPFIERNQGETALVDFSRHNRRDKETRSNEEDVDADKSAGKSWKARVLQNDGQDRDGAQTVNVWSVVHALGFQGVARAGTASDFFISPQA